MYIRILLNTTAVCALAAGIAAGARAEDRVAPSPRSGAMQASPATAEATPAFRPILAKRLIGTIVRDSADQKLGSVEDLVVASDRRIDRFVLSVGGLLGVGDRLVAVPVSSFSNGSDGLVLRGTTLESLKLLPEFEKTAFAEVNGGRADREAATIAPATLASAVIGAGVRDATGQKIGAVEDLVIGPERRVEQFVLSVGGFLGLGDKLVGLPVSAFQTRGEGLVLAGATKEMLEAAPAFDRAVFAAAAPSHPGSENPARAAAADPRSDLDRLKADYDDTMQEWGRRITEYRDKAARQAGESRSKLREGLDGAWDRAKAQWAELKDASAETYAAAKARLDRAIEELDRAWQETSG